MGQIRSGGPDVERLCRATVVWKGEEQRLKGEAGLDGRAWWGGGGRMPPHHTSHHLLKMQICNVFQQQDILE